MTENLKIRPKIGPKPKNSKFLFRGVVESREHAFHVAEFLDSHSTIAIATLREFAQHAAAFRGRCGVRSFQFWEGGYPVASRRGCVFVGGGVDEGWGVRVEGVGGCDQERT